MAGTLGNPLTHDVVSQKIGNVAQTVVNMYINNEVMLGDLQYCLGSDALMTAAGVDLVNHPEDGTTISNAINALTQIKTLLEANNGEGTQSIIQFFALLKGL